MRIIDRLKQISFSRQAFAVAIVFFTGLELLWQAFVLDVAAFIDNHWQGQEAWTIMGYYIRGANIICWAGFLAAFVLRCRDICMSVFYGIVIPALSMYLAFHYHNMFALYLPMFFMIYLLYRQGSSDGNLFEK